MTTKKLNRKKKMTMTLEKQLFKALGLDKVLKEHQQKARMDAKVHGLPFDPTVWTFESCHSEWTDADGELVFYDSEARELYSDGKGHPYMSLDVDVPFCCSLTTLGSFSACEDPKIIALFLKLWEQEFKPYAIMAVTEVEYQYAWAAAFKLAGYKGVSYNGHHGTKCILWMKAGAAK